MWWSVFTCETSKHWIWFVRQTSSSKLTCFTEWFQYSLGLKHKKVPHKNMFIFKLCFYWRFLQNKRARVAFLTRHFANLGLKVLEHETSCSTQVIWRVQMRKWENWTDLKTKAPPHHSQGGKILIVNAGDVGNCYMDNDVQICTYNQYICLDMFLTE